MVLAYIARIQEVNPILNAVVEDRFGDAIQEAIKADKMVATMSPTHLIKEYPILGVPFTVKESCALKGKTIFYSKLVSELKLISHINDNKNRYTSFSFVHDVGGQCLI